MACSTFTSMTSPLGIAEVWVPVIPGHCPRDGCISCPGELLYCPGYRMFLRLLGSSSYQSKVRNQLYFSSHPNLRPAPRL